VAGKASDGSSKPSANSKLPRLELAGAARERPQFFVCTSVQIELRRSGKRKPGGREQKQAIMRTKRANVKLNTAAIAGTVEWRRQLRVHSSNDDDADEAFYDDAAVLCNPGAHSNPL